MIKRAVKSYRSLHRDCRAGADEALAYCQRQIDECAKVWREAWRNRATTN
jgi:hypothetical protein